MAQPSHAALDFLLIEGVEQVTGRNPNTWTGFTSGGWPMDGWSTAGATDVTVRNLAIGGNATTDLHGAVSGSSASNWVYDWCSFWTPTNSVAGSVSGGQNIVFESCMIAAPLFSSSAAVANTTIVSNSYVANVSDGATTVAGGCYLFFANSTVNLSSTSLAINYASTLTQGTFYMAGCEIMFSGTGWAATLTNFASVTLAGCSSYDLAGTATLTITNNLTTTTDSRYTRIHIDSNLRLLDLVLTGGAKLGGYVGGVLRTLSLGASGITCNVHLGGDISNATALTVTGDNNVITNNEVTRLLHEWAVGSEEAASRLMELVYPELHRIAAWHLRGERQGHTLQATALVHEAYLRLARHPDQQWEGRAHFFALAARIVRRVLVDHARARETVKRREGRISVTLADADATVKPPDVDVLDLDAALTALEHLDATQSRVVELRYFAGLSNDETAAVLRVSKSSVKRDWVLAKTWLRQQMLGGHV